MLKVGDDVTPRNTKREGGYEDVKFSKYIGVNTACMKRLAIATKGCGQLASNDTYFADIWFIFVKTAEDMAAAGVDYFGPVKTSHKGFYLTTLEKLMKDLLGRSYLVMKINPRFPGERPLLAIGYK